MSRGPRRFHVEQAFFREGDHLRLSPRETFHLHRVLRLKAGDSCRIFNREGQGAEALIESISEAAALICLKTVYPLKKRNLFIKVAQALPQKRKMDELVDRAEELGVEELWVLETDRTIVKMKAEARERARKRWQRIVVEAAKQSGSSVLMKVEGPLPFETVMEKIVSPESFPFLFHPDPQGLSFSKMVEDLKSVEAGFKPAPTNVTPSVSLFFGPEGGFTEKEVKEAEALGVRKVFLGDSILRLETAFVGVLSALRLLWA